MLYKFWDFVVGAISLVVAATLISACSAQMNDRNRATEESAVYSALINNELEVPFSYLSGDPILLVNTTNYKTYGAIDDDFFYNNVSSLDKDTLEDFKAVNQASQALDLALSLNKPYEYIVFPTDENSWIQFGQNYPNAISITTLSGIGFNERFDQALVYMAYFCGSECGSANIYFLVRKGDIWTVEDFIEAWAS